MPCPASCSVLKNAPGKKVFVVARGEPHVARAERRAKRMIGHVEPAGREIEADGLDRPPAELLLQVDWKTAA